MGKAKGLEHGSEAIVHAGSAGGKFRKAEAAQRRHAPEQQADAPVGGAVAHAHGASWRCREELEHALLDEAVGATGSDEKICAILVIIVGAGVHVDVIVRDDEGVAIQVLVLTEKDPKPAFDALDASDWRARFKVQRRRARNA